MQLTRGVVFVHSDPLHMTIGMKDSLCACRTQVLRVHRRGAAGRKPSMSSQSAFKSYESNHTSPSPVVALNLRISITNLTRAPFSCSYLSQQKKYVVLTSNKDMFAGTCCVGIWPCQEARRAGHLAPASCKTLMRITANPYPAGSLILSLL